MRQMTVLLVEDNPRDVRLIQRAFDRAGFSHDLRIVRDGEAALAYLGAKGGDAEPNPSPRPDLILLDLNLRRMSGHDVLRQCKQNDHLKQIPIVVLTTSGHHDDIRQAYEAGANAYLLKPVEFARFTEVTGQLSTFWLDLVKLPPQAESESNAS